MRLWLNAGDGFIRSWEEPLALFELLFRKFLCEINRDKKVAVMCIRCMERLYAIHASKIGPFSDVMILVRSMASTNNTETQHRLLGLLATILGVTEDDTAESADVPENAEELLNVESIGLLCQFVAWGHTDRSTIGSIMARTLAANGPMIESGTSTPLSATKSDELRTDAMADSNCPPVWFIAASNKVPPPTELVQGPYRLSDLKRMMKEDELTPFHLVTTSHVSEYDSDAADDMLSEALIDTGKWKRLNEIWQLRWQLCRDDDSGPGIFTPGAVALLALKALTRLTELHRSLDLRGVPYYPIPLAKRVLCERNTGMSTDARPLSILAQSLLCTNDNVVDQAAVLLSKLLEHNAESMPKLYLTGVFFFACCYPGSNFKSLAKFLYGTHLKQRFLSGFAATGNSAEMRMKDRSILGSILPEGLLYVLDNYGCERFAEVFIGNVDTPEVIWTFAMRKHLIEMVRQHLGDFPSRLSQTNTAEYEYCPMPGVAYQRLEKEIFCHNYYLSNLCNEDKFPEWPISEPVEVFKACLEHFQKHVNRDEEDENVAIENAKAVLKLNPGDGTKELRKAHRSLARLYHPDKNPTGRDIFESIQASYELLLPVLESGKRIDAASTLSDEGTVSGAAAAGFKGGSSQMSALELLIKAQVLICRRYEKELSRYKYPAYDLLLQCIELPTVYSTGLPVTESGLLHPQRASFILSAVELVFRTCLVSPPNAEELVSRGGVAKLSSLLAFYSDVCLNHTDDAGLQVGQETLATIIMYLLRTISGLAHFESGRCALEEADAVDLCVKNICEWADTSSLRRDDATVRFNLVIRYALECIAPMARSPQLQAKLIDAGVFCPLLLKALLFDPSLKDEVEVNDYVQDDVDVHDLSAATSNLQASLAVRALGALSGAIPETEPNNMLLTFLNHLLTKPVAKMLRNKRTIELLRVLNSNTERADLIWNHSMKKQLEGLLQEIKRNRLSDTYAGLKSDLSLVEHFEFDVLRNEIEIGGVYLRVFNKYGSKAVSRITDPANFLSEITVTVALAMNNSQASERHLPIRVSPEDAVTARLEITDPIFLEAVKAFRTLTQTDGLLDSVIHEVGYSVPSVYVELLGLPVGSESFEIAGDILAAVCSRQDFADQAAVDGTLSRLLTIIQRLETTELSDALASERINRGWSCLEALVSSPSIANLLLSSNGWLEVVGVLAGYSVYTKLYAARVGAARTLSRLLWDPSSGTVTASKVERLLPATLTEILKESPEEMIKLFDSESDTPELIWNSSMRGELRKAIGDHLLAESDAPGMANRHVFVKYAALEKELFIGGVYVSKFVKEPTYNLRNPALFLESLLKRWDSELSLFASGEGSAKTVSDCTALADAEHDTLHLITSAIVYLCKVQDPLCDKLGQWGYMQTCVTILPRILSNKFTGTPLLSIMRLLHVASNRLTNVEALALTGDATGKGGIVELALNPQGLDSFDAQSGVLIELLLKKIKNAIGDATAAKRGPVPFAFPAPSPAPGEGSVRQKVQSGDDPLAMMGVSSSDANTQQSQTSFHQANVQHFPPQPAFTHASPAMSAYHQNSHGGIHLHAPQQTFNTGQYGSGSSFHESQSYMQYQPQVQSQHYMPQQQHINSMQPMPGQNTQSQYHFSNQPQQGQLRQVPQTRVAANVTSGPISQLRAQTNTNHPHLAQYVQNSGTQAASSYAYQTHPTTHGAYAAHPSQPGPSAYTRDPVPATQAPRQEQPSAWLSNGSQGHSQRQEQPGLWTSNAPQPSLSQSQIGPARVTQHAPTGAQMQWNASLAQSTGGGLAPHSVSQQSFQHGTTASFPVVPNQQQYQQPATAVSAPAAASSNPIPVVETVRPPTLQYAPDGVHGAGIDARRKEDPREVAEKQAVTSGGAPNSAQGRVALFQQALACDLCHFVMDKILENPKLQDAKDPVAAKTHAIDLLKTLTTDPGFGLKFKLILDDIPAWSKYKLQDHSLYLAGKDSRADYLLTDGGSDPKRLLTEH